MLWSRRKRGDLLTTLFSELKRRNVFRVGVAYVVIGWLLVQVSDTIAPMMNLPEWAPRMILYLMIIGLPVALFLAWAYELTPEGVKKSGDVEGEASVTATTGRKLDRVIIATLVMALGYFIWERQSSPPAPGVETVAEAPAPAAQSIAVLPFANLSDDPANEYFSDGISEELLNALAKVPRLNVAARTSSFAFKGRNMDVAEIARTLRVAHVLEGSVRKAGGRVRITAQLIKASDGFHLWSETYDRDLDDIFAVQDEIARNIVAALKVTLSLEDGDPLGGVGTANIDAYNTFLRGRFHLHKRGNDNVGRAVELFREAVELDPNFAEAHANLALALSVGWGHRDPRRALEAARTAMKISPDSSLSLTAFGFASLENQNWAEGSSALRKALEIDPRNAQAMHFLAMALQANGEAKEALVLEQQAASIDPTATIYRYWTGSLNLYLGRIDKGFEDLWLAYDLSPSSGIVFEIVTYAALTADPAGAETVLDEQIIKVKMPEDMVLRLRALIRVKQDRRPEAAQLLAEAERLVAGSGFGLTGVYVQLLLGNYDEADALLAMGSSELNSNPMDRLRYDLRYLDGVDIHRTRYNQMLKDRGLRGLDD